MDTVLTSHETHLVCPACPLPPVPPAKGTFAELDDPSAIRLGIEQSAQWTKAEPFTTHDLLLRWFLVLDMDTAVTADQEQRVNSALFDAGYTLIAGDGTPTWHWLK